MDQYEETFESWNKAASAYEQKFMNLEAYTETYSFLANSLHPNASVLDVGCGPGIITRQLLLQRPDLRITGLDISPNMVALAQKNNQEARFMVMDARHLRKLGGAFDAIACGFCLPYLDPRAANNLIHDCSVLLRRDGWLYLSWVPGDPAKSGMMTGSTGDRTMFHYYSVAEIRQQLTDAGLTFMRTFPIKDPFNKDDPQHMVLIARK